MSEISTMNQQQVVDLMKSSKSADEWDQNCDKVKRACGGYPAFWYSAIILSGVYEEVFGNKPAMTIIVG